MSSSSKNPYAIGSGNNVVRPLTYQPYQLPGQTAAPERQFLAQGEWRGLAPLWNDPQARAAMNTLTQSGVKSPQGQSALKVLDSRQKALGVQLPPHSNWGVTADGQIGLRYTDINNDYIAPIATAAATSGLAAGALSAMGAFGGASSAPSTTAAVPGSTAAAAPAAAVPGSTVGSGAFSGLSFGSTSLPAVAGPAAGAAGGGGAAGAAGAAGGAMGGTGSLISTGMDAATLAGNMVNASKNRKINLADLSLQQQKNFDQSQIDRAKLALDQQKNERLGQSDAYRKALVAALGGNVQDVQYTREGGFSGGLRPSAIGPQGQAAAGILGSQAMQALTHPEARPVLAPYERFKLGNQQPYEPAGSTTLPARNVGHS